MLLTFGTVLDQGEDAAGPRAVAAAGPALAAAYHAIYESKGADGVDRLPGGSEWRQAVETVEPPRRHLAIHDGHLIALSPHDQALLERAAPLLPSWTMTGTRTDIAARLGALTEAGITEVAYQPMGADIPRELAAFAQAAGLQTETETEHGDGDGDGRRMTTLVRLAKRHPGTSVDDFRRQTEAGTDWSSAKPHGLRSATQALTLPGAYRSAEPACDVIDELAFDDEASAAALPGRPGLRRRLGQPPARPRLDRLPGGGGARGQAGAGGREVREELRAGDQAARPGPGRVRPLLGPGARPAGGDDPHDQALRAGPPVARTR